MEHNNEIISEQELNTKVSVLNVIEGTSVDGVGHQYISQAVAIIVRVAIIRIHGISPTATWLALEN